MPTIQLNIELISFIDNKMCNISYNNYQYDASSDEDCSFKRLWVFISAGENPKRFNIAAHRYI